MRVKLTEPPRCTGRCAVTTSRRPTCCSKPAPMCRLANREGVMPMQLAAMNGNGAMLERLIKAGADVNAPLTSSGDTALMMAARTGKPDAVKVLLDNGAQVDAKETWGDTTALMWAVAEGNHAIVKMLIDRGANVNARTKFVPSATGRGFEGATPVATNGNQTAEQNSSGLLTPLMFAAREGDLESARMLVAAGANVNATDGDGKDALGLAIFNGGYDVASFLIDNHANVNQAGCSAIHPIVLGRGPPQHGNGSELSLGCLNRSSSADQETARRRGQRQLCRE